LASLERIADTLRAQRGWRRLAIAAAIGAVGALAFPPFHLFPLILLGYAVLILLLDGAAGEPAALRRAAAIGWSYGFGFCLVGFHWIGYPFLVTPEQHAWLMPLGIVFFPAGLALFFAFAASLYAAFWRPGVQRIFLFTACFVIAEWLRGHIFTGLPWNIPGYGWGGSTAILQSAALFGVYGLSIFTLLLGGSFALLLRRERSRVLPFAMIALFVLLWAGGALRLANADASTVPGVQLRIVQPATPQREKYVREFVPRNWQWLVEPTLAPAEIAPTHVIWPEAATPFLVLERQDALDAIAQMTANGLVLLTGSQRAERAADGTLRRAFNSFFIFADGGEVAAAYDKFHLVPFGEYLPFERTLNSWGITQIAGGISGFSQGPGPMTFDVPRAPPVSPLICYEIVFPGEVTGAPRPGWLVNITDDSWFGPDAGPQQHLLIARVRAIEEGLPVARAANAGISVIIDGYGRIRNRLDLGERGFIDGPLPVALSETPYVRFGGPILFVLLLACIGAAFVPLRPKRT
jgi:apolipoprotein N-acyltransferase